MPTKSRRITNSLQLLLRKKKPGKLRESSFSEMSDMKTSSFLE